MKSEGISQRDAIRQTQPIHPPEIRYIHFKLSAYGSLAVATVLALSILPWIGRRRGLFRRNGYETILASFRAQFVLSPN
jgi:hypothetical protein